MDVVLNQMRKKEKNEDEKYEEGMSNESQMLLHSRILSQSISLKSIHSTRIQKRHFHDTMCITCDCDGDKFSQNILEWKGNKCAN